MYVVNTETICTYDGQNVVPVSGKINKGDYIIKVMIMKSAQRNSFRRR